MVSSALFLIVIYMSVLHTMLPTLTRELSASASEKLWIMNAYALVVPGLLPGCGTLGDRVGHKRMFAAGLAVFGVLAALVSAFSVTGLSLVMSQRLQLVLGYSPLHAALFLLPGSVLAFIGGPLSGWLTPRYGANGVMAGALPLGGCGVAGLFLSNAGLLPQLLWLALFGLGAGVALAAASDAIMSYAPPERVGMAASIDEVSIELDGAMGTTC